MQLLAVPAQRRPADIFRDNVIESVVKINAC
jgi:hypothetical protein